MGDTLFHFIFPFLALLIARPKFKHRLIVAILLAASAALLDIDHFFGMVPRGTLHNVFVTLVFPLTIFALAFVFEKKGTYYKNVSLALLLFLFSHPMVDIFTGGAGLKLFYPLSEQEFFLNSIKFSIPLPNGQIGYVISSNGIGLSIYTAMILAVIFVEDFNRFLMKLKKPEKALIKTIEYEEKKIEKEI
jgi:membrane-bound metal-dependent hydrolase YbcI (DUF457 family)